MRLPKRALVLAMGLAATACGQGNTSKGVATEPDAGADDASTQPADSSRDASSEADAQPTDATPSDGLAPSTPGGSRCTEAPEQITCTHREVNVKAASFDRLVTYEVPLGAPPASGFPVVVYFQGSFVPGHGAFEAKAGASFGMYQLTRTVKALLDNGYAVLSPDALSDGQTYWQTNIPPWATSWEGSADDALMKKLFAALTSGTFGAVDTSRLYAMGISSGGFMTSRMAVSYAGKFRALAVHSAGYATCSGSVAGCAMPKALPKDHPPTLFLHGEKDATVPKGVMELYRDKLVAEGREVETVLDASAGHEWLSQGAETIRAWFDAHP